MMKILVNSTFTLSLLLCLFKCSNAEIYESKPEKENLSIANKNEPIPERVVHAKGAGAFGYFLLTNKDIAKYSKAKIFSDVNVITPIFVRFSTREEENLPKDSIPDIRGLAIKFYTDDGNWDIVANNLPLSYVRDPKLFVFIGHILKRDPITNLRDPNLFWDFISSRPESMFQISLSYLDFGFPDGFRFMNGYGINTFKFVNSENKIFYCKYYFKSDQGIKYLSPKKAARIQADYSKKDLRNAISKKQFPCWTFYVQIMTDKDFPNIDFNPFDATRLWPQDKFPLIEVGKIVLNENPSNFVEQVEKVAFDAGNMPPGIEPSLDKMLLARIAVYPGAQMKRLGEKYKQIPINREKVNLNTSTTLEPNKANDHVKFYEFKDDDEFKQVRKWFLDLNKDQRKRLTSNLANALRNVNQTIQLRFLENLRLIDIEYNVDVSEGL